MNNLFVCFLFIYLFTHAAGEKSINTFCPKLAYKIQNESKKKH